VCSSDLREKGEYCDAEMIAEALEAYEKLA